MECFRWTNIAIIVLILTIEHTTSVYVCPRQCECELSEGMRKVSCLARNIVDINLGIPKYVQIIDVSYNSFTQIENNAFKKYKSLIELDLSHNLIKWIALNGFEGLDDLSVLNLSYNRLEGLTAELFQYNKVLEALDLSGNKLLSFANTPFISHKNLKKLNISNSRISFVPDKFFEDLPSLIELDLSDNYMIQLQIATLKPIAKLNRLFIDNNHWQCNSVMNELQTWLTHKYVRYNPQCKFDRYNNTNKFEKIILLEQPQNDEEDRDIDELWNIHEVTSTQSTYVTDTVADNQSFFELYNRRVPPLFSLMIGFELGIVFGILGTFCWMSKLYKCRTYKFRRISCNRSRNDNIRNEGRVGLLMNSSIGENCATPPAQRRLPFVSRSFSWQPSGFEHRAVPVFNASVVARPRPETPPPGYNEALNDTVLSC